MRVPIREVDTGEKEGVRGRRRKRGRECHSGHVSHESVWR